jgi:dipeptidyl aminopeptidase/acylaminoacyl peptidase
MDFRRRYVALALPGGICLALFLGLRADSAAPVPRSVTVAEGTNLGVTVSPDRKRIILDLQTALWLLPASGGTAKRITDSSLEASHPDWSSKGDLVAFQSFHGGTFHIWVMKPDGTGRRQLTDGHGDDREPRFSPDGARVAFSSDRSLNGSYDIWVVDVASGKLTQWTSGSEDEYDPSWSPDGNEIAYVSGTGALATSIAAARAGGEPRTVLRAPQGARFNAPSWSPNAKQIAYVQTLGNKARLMVGLKALGSADDTFPFPAVWLSSDQVMYTADGKIWKTRVSTGETQNVPFQATFTIDRTRMVQKLNLAEDTRYYHAVFEGPYLRYAVNSFVM